MVELSLSKVCLTVIPKMDRSDALLPLTRKVMMPSLVAQGGVAVITYLNGIITVPIL